MNQLIWVGHSIGKSVPRGRPGGRRSRNITAPCRVERGAQPGSGAGWQGSDPRLGIGEVPP